MAVTVTVPLPTGARVAWLPFGTMEAMVLLETLHAVTDTPLGRLFTEYVVAEHNELLPVTTAVVVNGARPTVQVLVAWATPLIEGVTETEEGKTVPLFGVSVIVLLFPELPDHPL